MKQTRRLQGQATLHSAPARRTDGRLAHNPSWLSVGWWRRHVRRPQPDPLARILRRDRRPVALPAEHIRASHDARRKARLSVEG